MDWLQTIASNIGNLFKWWFLVLPWEQAVRVRLGKHIVVLEQGIHLRIPYVDKTFVQNTRKRMAPIPAQTLTTLDYKIVTISGSLRYEVCDALKLLTSLHQPEDTICQEVEAMITEFVIHNKLEDCTGKALDEYVIEKLDLSSYGLKGYNFFLTNFAVVQTFRVIGGDLERYPDSHLRVQETRN